jgi:nuclease-like protein
MYHAATKTVRCVDCPADAAPFGLSAADVGVAGASSQAEYERRKASHEAGVKGRLGDILGGVVLAVAGDAQSTTAWRRGAIGEQKLAEAISGVDGVRALNDRRVPGTRGNIDHLVIAPPGVFVVDAKLYKGLIKVRDKGGWFTSDKRLYVGRRDCSRLAENMGWQVAAVGRALTAAGLHDVPIQPVLCFIDGDWSLFAPQSYRGVRLEGKRSIKVLISGRRVLDEATIDRVSRILAIALPANR